jgi:cell division protein FtsW
VTNASAAGAPAQTYDVQLLFAVLFLVGIGIVMVYSASSALALKKYGSGFHFLKKQALFSLVGIVALVVCSHIPYRIYRAMTYPILALALAGLVAVLVSGVGLHAGGSQRWIRLGPLTFQPVEAARLALITFMAYSLSKKHDGLRQFGIGFVPHVLMLLVFAVPLMLQPDFGSVVIFGTLVWMMMFVAGVPIRHLLSALLLMVPAAYFLMINATYRIKRLISFLDPWQYPAGEGYQIIHSLMAFGTGGLWGTGIGKGYQKLFYLPEPHTDFIFAVIGEELGFWGVLGILALYALVIWRGTRIAFRCPDEFGMLMAFGIVTAIGLQVAINMGVALGLLPTKGLTLPFLSYGGTSLVFNMACIGILMNIGTRHAQKV